MSMPKGTADDFLTISPRIRVLPIIHGSGDFAIQVREELLNRPYDCVAVPLPPSFQEDVEAAIERLPAISVVVQVDAEPRRIDDELGFSYVPIDPCQGVIAALRTARRRADRARVHRPGDASVRAGHRRSFPIRTRSSGSAPERFAAALLAAIPPPVPGQNTERDRLDGRRLRELESRYRLILSSARSSTGPGFATPTSTDVLETRARAVLRADRDLRRSIRRTLIFALGELPYITGLYERGRAS